MSLDRSPLGGFAYTDQSAEATEPRSPSCWPDGWSYPPPPYPPGFNADNSFWYIAIADGGTVPTGWQAMNGDADAVCGDALPDLRGLYLRGATTVSLAPAGSKTHTHTFSAVTSAAGGAHTHLVGQSSGYLADLLNTTVVSYHTHTSSSASTHTHAVNFYVNAGTSIPSSRVIDWICKALTTAELNAFPAGTILGFLGATANIPTGWVTCDGTNSTPNLVSKFPYVASSAGSGGADAHTHTSATTTASGGAHTHTYSTVAGVATGVDSPVSGDTYDSDAASHLHTIPFAEGAHTHTFAQQTSASTTALPPYVSVLFIMKSAAASGTSTVASGVYCLFNPAASTPTGWTAPSAFLSRFLVGYKASDSDFGTRGNITAATHTHAGIYMTAVGGTHTHTSGAMVIDSTTSLDSGSSVNVLAAVGAEHTHTMGAETSGHAHNAAANTSATALGPAYTQVKCIAKT